MKRTIISAIVLAGIIFSVLFTQSTSNAEESTKMVLVSFSIVSDAPNSGGSISGPVVRNFVTNNKGAYTFQELLPEGYYCVCVSGTGGGCVPSHYHAISSTVTVNNNATCICGD